MIDIQALPPRIALPDVLELAGYGRTTLRKRQRDGRMPLEIDRGGRGGIFDRDAVLCALGLKDDGRQEERDPWEFDDAAFNKAFSRPLRGSKKARGR